MVPNHHRIDNMAMTLAESAYLAGLFDGEGCITSQIIDNQAHVRIIIAQKSPMILNWIKEQTGIGSISLNTSNNNCYYRVTGRENVRKFIKLIYPFSKIKKDQLLVGYALASLVGKVGSNKTNTYRQEKRTELHNNLRELKVMI
jgi:hypothetical protein